jgi:hypothetical protein
MPQLVHPPAIMDFVQRFTSLQNLRDNTDELIKVGQGYWHTPLLFIGFVRDFDRTF